MFDRREVLLAELHRQQLVKDAQKRRLVREALAGRAPQPRPYVRILGWTGKRLMVMGTALQARYSAYAQNSPAIEPENESDAMRQLI